MRKPRTRRKHAAAPLRPIQTTGPALSENKSTTNAVMEGKLESTPKEAEVVAKNYRLAKELNELRVKYKEETNTVARLSVENMKLASQFRQALNKINALQKEISEYQQNYTRKSEYSSNGNGYGDISPQEINVNNNMARTNRVKAAMSRRKTLAAKYPQAPQQDSPSAFTSDRNEFTGMDESTVTVDRGMTVETKQDEEIERDIDTPPPVTPESDEDAPIQKHARENDLAEAGFGELHPENFFQQPTYSSSLGSTPEKENVDVDAVSKKFDSFLSVRQNNGNRGTRGTDGAKGIDAFEASFETTFPSSFRNSSPSMDNSFGNSDFSDSFFMDTSPKSKEEEWDAADNEDESPSVNSVPSHRYGQGHGNGNGHGHQGNMRNYSDDTKQAYVSEIDAPMVDAPMDEALQLFPNSVMSGFEPSFSKPQNEENGEINDVASTHNNPGVMIRVHPERKEREEEDLAPKDEVEADSGEHSPTLVLKRLQQRKAKANGANSPRGSMSMNDEMRKLDAMAHAVQPRDGLQSREGEQKRDGRRRGIRQPISYAEPTLNSKLRRGDVYFAKKGIDDEKTDENNDNSHNAIVVPAS